MHRLITIPFSHYNERARWGLDVCGLRYVERGYLPGLHLLPVAWATKGKGRADHASSRFSTPVLVTEGGEVLADSEAILRFANDRRAEGVPDLYASPEVAAIHRELHDDLGPHARRLAYHALFAQPHLLRALAFEAAGEPQTTLFWLSRHRMMVLLRRRFDITDEGVARSREVVRRVFTMVGERLHGRAYLAGERFSAADLTFAALGSLMLLPSREEGFVGPTLPSLDVVGPALRDLVDELRATPAGQHGLRIYREHRRSAT
ncbi:MAG: glutathione S-transferase [Polyangiaceae bacterium]